MTTPLPVWVSPLGFIRLEDGLYIYVTNYQNKFGPSAIIGGITNPVIYNPRNGQCCADSITWHSFFPYEETDTLGDNSELVCPRLMPSGGFANVWWKLCGSTIGENRMNTLFPEGTENSLVLEPLMEAVENYNRIYGNL